MPVTTLLLALLPVCTSVQDTRNASGGELRPDQATWDVLHYDLELKVVPEERWIQGRLTMRALALAELDRLALQLDGALQVTDVTGMLANDEAWRPGRDATGADRSEGLLSLALNGEVTRIPAGAEFSIQVDYEGRPRVAPNPPWKGGFTWSETADGRPWVATSCQGEGADLWWPCKDHPSDKPESMDLFITVPKGLFCASNGVLVSDETGFLSQGQVGDGSLTVSEQPWRTLHWRVSEPIANYAVALNIAPYEVLEQPFTSVDDTTFPVFFWYLPENAEQARTALPEFLDHLRHLESVCGPYPFRAEKYALVETPHLGMEHQTIIAYGNKYRGGPDGFDWLHHHELSHEWWGNLVTCRDWKDMWLHEGFATYMQALYAEERSGPAGLRKFMRRNRAQLGNRRPVAPRETQDSQQIYFDLRGKSDSDIYYKGAWVLHTLRWQLGDAAFFELLKRFAYPTEERLRATDGSQERFVDTEDFRRLAEEVHGADLGWFFEVYLRRPELPELELRRAGERLELSWKVPGGGPFPLDVPLAIDGVPVRVEMDETGHGSVAAGATNAVDPDGWLLMR